jgi:hypothetical protein
MSLYLFVFGPLSTDTFGGWRSERLPLGLRWPAGMPFAVPRACGVGDSGAFDASGVDSTSQRLRAPDRACFTAHALRPDIALHRYAAASSQNPDTPAAIRALDRHACADGLRKGGVPDSG